MSGATNPESLDGFIGSAKYKENPAAALPSDAFHALLETLSHRSQAERDVTSRVLGTLVTHLDKKLADQLLTEDAWTDEQFAGNLLADVLLRDTRAEQWELEQQIQGAERFRELVRSAGGALTVKEVARWTGTTTDAVIKQINRGNLIAYKAISVWYVLRAQFQEDGSVVPGVREALHPLRALSRMDQVRFFLSRIEGREETPLQQLQAVPSAATIATVLRLAEQFMVHGGA